MRADLDDEVLEEALDVFRSLLAWKLFPSRWELVARILDSVEDAFAAGDAIGMGKAVGELWMVGQRATRVGDVDPAQPPEEPVRERINKLIYRVGVAVGKEGPERREGGTDVDRSSSR